MRALWHNFLHPVTVLGSVNLTCLVHLLVRDLSQPPFSDSRARGLVAGFS
jgi:hypothetical protein